MAGLDHSFALAYHYRRSTTVIFLKKVIDQPHPNICLSTSYSSPMAQIVTKISSLRT